MPCSICNEVKFDTLYDCQIVHNIRNIHSTRINHNLYNILEGVVPKNVLTSKNKAKTWKYGYNPKYDFIVISKTGQIEDVIEIQGLRIALPKPPKNKT